VLRTACIESVRAMVRHIEEYDGWTLSMLMFCAALAGCTPVCISCLRLRRS
jgi:hypothetical protein